MPDLSQGKSDSRVTERWDKVNGTVPRFYQMGALAHLFASPGLDQALERLGEALAYRDGAEMVECLSIVHTALEDVPPAIVSAARRDLRLDIGDRSSNDLLKAATGGNLKARFRLFPLGLLALRRDRPFQCLAHHSPVHIVLLGQLADRLARRVPAADHLQ